MLASVCVLVCVLSADGYQIMAQAEFLIHIIVNYSNNHRCVQSSCCVINSSFIILKFHQHLKCFITTVQFRIGMYYSWTGC